MKYELGSVSPLIAYSRGLGQTAAVHSVAVLSVKL